MRAGEADCLRVAIVGFGPKGLYTLERLLDHAHRAKNDAQMIVDIFEPHPFPGAGPNYDPRQPDYLLMNVASDTLDMWGPDSRAAPAGEGLSFVRWRAECESDQPAARYPARASVGRYFIDGFRQMRRACPSGVAVNVRRVEVEYVRRRGDGWEVGPEAWAGIYDEVLLSVGHDTVHPMRPSGAVPVVPRVFPVSRHLSQQVVAPGAVVAVRGFALTFIDAALALTEGRGGTFREDGNELRHIPAAREVSTIIPYCRSGRPMLAKSDPELALSIHRAADVVEAGQARVRALKTPLTNLDGFVDEVARTAGNYLCASNGRTRREHTIRAHDDALAWMRAASQRRVAEGNPEEVVSQIRASVEIGLGRQRPNLAWALGQAWRELYPSIVEHLGAAGIGASCWPEFRRVAADMERLAFGPPPVNAAKLLALVASGRVDLSYLTGAQVRMTPAGARIEKGPHQRLLGAVVNAVIAEPGGRPPGNLLIDAVIADGHAHVPEGRRGLQVDVDATCIGADGRPMPGLAVVGRATEDWVIGNDTLSRSLHQHTERWAARVVLRATQAASSGRATLAEAERR